MRKILLSVTIILLAWNSSWAQAKTRNLFSPTGFVNDFAEVLEPRTKVGLEEKLRRFSADEGVGIAVVTIKTSGNISISEFSLSLAQNWKIGPATKPSYGVLLIAAIDDSKYWTQVSRDAEEVFSNSWLDWAQKQYLVPEFQKGNYGQGLSMTVDAYMNKFKEFKRNKKQELDRKFVKYTPGQLLNGSTQAVVVKTSGWDAFKATVQLFERTSAEGDWTPVGSPFSAVVGQNGLAWSDDVAYLLGKNPDRLKREGDGRAPAGIFDLTFAFGSNEKTAASKLPFTRLEESTECVDDSTSASYNRIVDRFRIGNFDWTSSEKMLAVGPQYELGVFVAHNSDPVKNGGGSCIFLHIWKNEDSGTAGCTAMSRENLETMLGWLDPAKNPRLVQFPAEEYERLQESWKLPKVK